MRYLGEREQMGGRRQTWAYEEKKDEYASIFLGKNIYGDS